MQWIEEGSDGFMYVDVVDGDKFIMEGIFQDNTDTDSGEEPEPTTQE